MGVVVALLGLAGSLFLLGQATAPPEQGLSSGSTTTSTTEALSLPTTTTTIDFENFTISAIATGERLSWIRAPSLVTGWPVALIAFDDRLWLFTAAGETGPYRRSAGLDAWVSDDGVDWRPAGRIVDEEFTVARVENVGSRLVVMASRISDGAPHVWTSEDGARWSKSEMPMSPDALAPGYRTWFAGAGTSGDLLAVAGFVEPSSDTVILERLPPEVAEAAHDYYGLGLSEGPGGERRVDVYGPLGLLGFSASLNELGIDPDTANSIFSGGQVDRSFLWTTGDGSAWSTAPIGDLWAEQFAVLSDGDMVVLGGDQAGQGIWRSSDGVRWERTSITLGYTWLLGTRGDELMGVIGDKDLVSSVNGMLWDSMGTAELLPGRLYWNLGPFAWDGQNVAVIATTYPDTPVTEAVAVTVEEDGNLLTYDPNAGTVVISDGVRDTTYRTWSEGASGPLEMDFAAEQVTFFDPETKTAIATFSFETLRTAETAALGRPQPGLEALLLQGPDGAWSVIDLAEGIGATTQVFRMTFFDNRLAMLTTSSSGSAFGEPASFTVRVATLP